MSIKKICIISSLLAIAIVLNIIESSIPMFIPGVKLGLANIVVLIMLYEFNLKEAFLVMILRIILVGLLRGNIFQLQWFMSLSGGILSFIIMLLFSKIKFFSPIGVSILGAIFHCIGQIIIAIIMLSTAVVIYYLPFIAILSTLTGILNGIIVKTYLKHSITKKIFIK